MNSVELNCMLNKAEVTSSPLKNKEMFGLRKYGTIITTSCTNIILQEIKSLSSSISAKERQVTLVLL